MLAVALEPSTYRPRASNRVGRGQIRFSCGVGEGET